MKKFTHSLETRKKMSESKKGKKKEPYSEKHKARISEGHWKRNVLLGFGALRKGNGRWTIRCRNGRTELWSRIVYKNSFLNGDDIPEGYEIHHKDENPENDIPENLEMLTRGEHRRIHHKGKVVSIETRERLSTSLKGKSHPCSLETRKKRSDIMKGRKLPESAKINSIKTWTGRKHTEEAKKKNSDAHLGKSCTSETKKKISETMKNKEHTEEYKQKKKEAMNKAWETRRFNRQKQLEA